MGIQDPAGSVHHTLQCMIEMDEDVQEGTEILVDYGHVFGEHKTSDYVREHTQDFCDADNPAKKTIDWNSKDWDSDEAEGDEGKKKGKTDSDAKEEVEAGDKEKKKGRGSLKRKKFPSYSVESDSEQAEEQEESEQAEKQEESEQEESGSDGDWNQPLSKPGKKKRKKNTKKKTEKKKTTK